MKHVSLGALVVAAGVLSAVALARHPAGAGAPPHLSADDPVSAGRYLVNYGGCNDCHTPGWGEKAGAVPESQRLTGSGIGYQGPWGVSYPANLRRVFARMSVERWLAMVKNPGDAAHPPMPWGNIQGLSEADQRAIYAYIHSLGAAGEPAPRFVPPGTAATTPVIPFVPVMPKGASGG